MREIIKIKFGSHLYGTDTPQSDLDFKSIFVPSSRDLLLQRAPKTLSTCRPKGEGEKNYAGEVEEESYSLQQFLKLVSEGQTVAMDILFAPRWATVGDPSGDWLEIQSQRYRLLTKKSSAFLGYCRQQANKYGIKGSRVAAARAAKDHLEWAVREYGSTEKLQRVESMLIALTAQHEHMQILDIEGAQDIGGHRRTVRHWEVCNRKMPFTQTIKGAHEVMGRIVNEYGRRALQAEKNEGVDWKALSHAVRIGHQAIELLDHGRITFPRPEAEHLLSIKMGKLEYKPVANEIEHLLEEVEQAAEKSSLPQQPDYEWIESFVAKVHYKQAISGDTHT